MTTSIAAVHSPSLRMPPCPCCQSEEVGPLFCKDEIDYYLCRACRFTFIFPWPDDQTLQNHYSDYGRRYYSRDGLKEFLLSSNHYHRELELLSRTAKLPCSVLDVGCSVGGFVRVAGARG